MDRLTYQLNSLGKCSKLNSWSEVNKCMILLKFSQLDRNVAKMLYVIPAAYRAIQTSSYHKLP